jgi:hypothetical protein
MAPKIKFVTVWVVAPCNAMVEYVSETRKRLYPTMTLHRSTTQNAMDSTRECMVITTKKILNLCICCVLCIGLWQQCLPFS